ncbi:Aste57867_17216 [Aphanomyces stellatus]|uniref:Aste57867_17216 protein n=1 Tax=Aphanomyces stellatus TaxID=120398 RepID=A0A485L865_9STRA|nr:hypothetical protein As57867_017157 [Aphanomyces stellatus]VFT93973.1 Aste57867_17216 [Aphanomyces stellatus]
MPRIQPQMDGPCLLSTNQNGPRIPSNVVPPSAFRTVPLVVGLLYSVVTVSISVLYLVILSPSIANDFWWPRFTTSGTQTFLGDLFNAQSTLHASGSLDLFAPTSVIAKDYTVGSAFISMRPAAARAILLDNLPLQEAIRLIRAISLMENMRTAAPSCWLDFNRTFEMAHTARRQAMCNTNRTTNAAVYLESLLRNVQTRDLLSSTYYPEIQSGLFAAARLTPSGAAWVWNIETHTWPSIPDEETFWRTFGITIFKNTLQNYYLEGVENSIVLVNALGLRQRITVNNIPNVMRPKVAWTTAYAFCGLWNDLDSSAQFGGSLLRSAPNSFIALGIDWDAWYCGSAGTPGTALIRSQLGPLTIIDIYLVPVPARLFDLISTFHTALFSQLAASNSDYMALEEPIVHATPRSWVQPNTVYYGGNPVCAYGKAMPFVQAPFGYYDDCGLQSPHEIQLMRETTLFAFFTRPAQHTDAVCAMMFPETTCQRTLNAASQVFARYLGPVASSTNMTTRVQNVLLDVLPLNVSFIQWATVDNIDQILYQAMVGLESESDPWSFLGWMTLYDWANGQREVYRFEGDYSSVTLMSRRHDLVPLAAITAELPRTACLCLWVVCLYVTCILSFVVLLASGAAAVFQLPNAHNLLMVNRVIGSVWIGRPFLFLRGLTAIVVLSTSPVAFHASDLARLDFAPRPLWHTCILAGEATWVAYVLHDILAPVTKPITATYAHLGSLLSWVVLVGLECVAPVRATATLNHECTIVSFTAGVQCTSGEVQIGSFERLTLVFGVILVVNGGAYVLHQCCRTHASPMELLHVIFPSASEVFLLRPHPSSIDTVFCILSGLIPLGTHIFDIKLWVFF